MRRRFTGRRLRAGALAVRLPALAIRFRALAFRARVLHDTHGQPGEKHDEQGRRARYKRAITLREFSQTVRD